MSNNTILRKYLDILSEVDAAPADPAPVSSPDAGTTDKQDNQSAKSSVQSLAQKVVTSVTEFQKGIMSIASNFPPNAPERKVKATGAIDPVTLVTLYAHFNQAGQAGKQVASDVSSPSDQDKISENIGVVPNPSGATSVDQAKELGASMPVPATAPAITQEELEHKAELHDGYAKGLRGDSHHSCDHEPGSKKHLHWTHGYAKGSKEFAECMAANGVYTV
jgi:hypothetical protein